MLKLKLQYFGQLMQRTDSLEKTLMLRKIEGAIEMGDPRRHGRAVAASAKKVRGRNQAHLELACWKDPDAGKD